MPNGPAEPRRITLQRPGPLLVEGPVEVTLEDGTTVSSDRFCVALCTCRRSRIYPWCDTSHRRRADAGHPPHTDAANATGGADGADTDGPHRAQAPPI